MKGYKIALLAVSALIAAQAFIFAPVSAALVIPANMTDMPYPHYLRENRQRYEAYHAQNPGVPYSKIIAYVNADADITDYNDIVTVEDPDNIAILLNRRFALPTGYISDDMTDIGGGHMMREEAARQFLNMKADMAALGYRICVITIYRSYQAQIRNYNRAAASSGLASAESQFARPGHSEHQTGLAVDLLQRTGVVHMSDARFETTGEYAWLRENAHKYGFILRYPREYRHVHGFIFEPWHWRYVGPDIATAMYEEGIGVFEEYYGKYLAPGVAAKRAAERTSRIGSSIFE